MAKKLPYFPFFVGDWVKDTRMLSLPTRALWMDMLCLMHDSDRRGYLSRAGKPLTPEQIAAYSGCSAAEVSHATQELLDSGVCSCTEHGVLFSRRMVRDERKRRLCSEAGKKGGNPNLKDWNKLPGFVYALRRESDGAVKIGGSVAPADRRAGQMGSLRGESTKLLQQWSVTRMADAELMLHEEFSDQQIDGEWFRMSDEDVASITEILTFKGLLKGGLKPPLDMECGNGVVSSSSEPKAKRKAAPESEGFAQFWAAYPRKQAKQAAKKAWQKLQPCPELVTEMLAALERQKVSEQWQGGIIPHAATWLNGRRWEDEAGPKTGRQAGLLDFASGGKGGVM